jgi:NAD(P)-dependent dehydrogenase (short-subunit alcohol dehydrogenase family)
VQADTVTRIFATNVLGPTMLVQAALPHLERSRGAVINISSTYGHKAAPLISHYAASKAALEHLTRCWALELAARGIRVNAVAPGPTETEALASFGLSRSEVEEIQRRETEMIPLGRRGVTEEIARWIVRLASPEEDWITGQVIAVDGGLSLM